MNSKKNKEGLTIVELLATITILVAVVATMLALGDRAVAQTALFSSRTQALFLTKEGMEMAGYLEQELRSDIAKDEGWDGTGFWIIDYDEKVEKKESEDKCKEGKIRIHGPGQGAHEGLYGYKSGDPTPFSRCVIIRADNENDNLKAIVETFFTYRGEEHSVKLYRIFYD